MKILAVVKFNEGHALVLDEAPKLVYKKVGNIIYGTDGLFYKCYEYGRMGENWKAFAGSKFTLTMEDGEKIECVGQWWDAGQTEVGKIVGRTIGSATLNTLESLKKCYVFTGYDIDIVKYHEFIKTYTGTVFEYGDYEKIIKYDDERSKLWRKIQKLERDKKQLIKEVKLKHLELTENYKI